MKRRYRLGERNRRVEVLPDVTAIVPGGARKRARARGRVVSKKTLSVEERQPFEECGFQFRRRAAKRRDEGWAGRVCIDAQGRIGIVCQRMTVKLDPRLTRVQARRALQRYRLQLVAELRFGKHLYDVRLPAAVDPFRLANQLEADRQFVFACPELLERSAQRFTPTDVGYHRQWQWQKVAAESAWDVTRGVTRARASRRRRPIRIAVIDWGLDVENPDLKPALRHCGYFRENDGSMPATFFGDCSQLPANRHGTYCAFLAVARANSDYPCCGMANLAELIPVACLTGGVGSQQSFARALAFAADPSQEDPVNFRKADGADVISCSIYLPNPWDLSPVVTEALQFAVSQGRGGKGALIFYAVDNSNSSIARDALAKSELTISVGKTNRFDLQTNSAQGEGLDFVAPGVDVVVAKSRRSTTAVSGTSFATPLAAGIAALTLAAKPNWTWRQVRQHLRDTCDKVGRVRYDERGFHKRYGYGRLNAARAVGAPEPD